MVLTQYKYIHWRKSASQKGFIVQYNGKTHGGFNANLEVAKRILRGVLRLRPGQRLPVRKPKQKMSGRVNRAMPKRTLQKVQFLSKYIQARQSRVPDGGWPCDMEASLVQAHRSKAMYAAEPALHFLSLGLKYGPLKESLLRLWGAAGKLKGKDLKIMARVLHLKKLVKGLAQGNAKSPVPKVWPQNCNRFRYREQGPHIVYKRLGIIRKPKKSEKGVYFIEGQGHGGDRSAGAWCLQEIPGCSMKVESFIQASDAVIIATEPAARTCSERHAKMHASSVGFRNIACMRGLALER